MIFTFEKPITGGTVSAIPSKSVAHRMLICAALAGDENTTEIICPVTSEDIDATVRCLRALGAVITRTAEGFLVTPIRFPLPKDPVLDCGESGSTLRFLLPIAATIADKPVQFVRRGRLAQRPLSPLYEELIRHGAKLPADPATEPLSVCGPLTAGDYTLAANVSSQFVSGLLMSFADACAPCTLTLTGTVESADYIRITTSVMQRFGIRIDVTKDGRQYSVAPCPYRSPGKIAVEGDWSGAALWLCAGAIGKSPVTVTGLDTDSPQGDRRILDVLRQFGAGISVCGDAVTVSPSPLRGITFDASQIPDLVPVLSVVAAAAERETVITGIARLRLKESDRAAAIETMLTALGADVQAEPDRIVVRGGKKLTGGTVSSAKDHRMVMCAALCSLIADGTVSVTDAQSIAKSYPGFAADWRKLGGILAETED